MDFQDKNLDNQLTNEDAIDLVLTCTTTKNDAPEDWDPVETHISLISSFASAKILSDYPLGRSEIDVIYSHSAESDRKEWDGDFLAFVIFKFSKGFGLAIDVGWWSPTFTGHKYTLEICETDDYYKFDSLCLTDEIRDKFCAINYEIERGK